LGIYLLPEGILEEVFCPGFSTAQFKAVRSERNSLIVLLGFGGVQFVAVEEVQVRIFTAETQRTQRDRGDQIGGDHTRIRFTQNFALDFSIFIAYIISSEPQIKPRNTQIYPIFFIIEVTHALDFPTLPCGDRSALDCCKFALPCSTNRVAPVR
jgi:hypothetical protein